MALHGTASWSSRSAAAVRRRPLLTFYLLLLAVSWPVMLLLRNAGELSLVVLVLVGPSACAFAVAALGYGRDGVYTLWHGVRRWRATLPLYLFVLVGVPATWFTSAYLVVAVVRPDQLAVPPATALLSTAINFVPVLVIAGLGEEFGWRGFALPRMQDRLGPLRASLVLGLMWFAWHLPLTLVGPDGPTSTGLFLVEVTFATAIYTWVFNRSGGSVLLVALLHATNNAWTGHAFQATFGVDPPGFLFFVGVKTATLVLLALAVLLLTRGKLGYSANRP